MLNTVKLENIVDIYSGVNINRYTNENYVKGKTLKKQKVFTQEAKKESKINGIREINIAENLDLKYYTKKGDIIFKLALPNNATKIENEEFMDVIVPSRFAILRNKGGIDLSYLVNYLNSDIVNEELIKFNEGGKLPIVKLKDLKNLSILLPPLETQKKYGKLLDLINNNIQLYEKAIESEKKIKEGILNELVGENNE